MLISTLLDLNISYYSIMLLCLSFGSVLYFNISALKLKKQLQNYELLLSHEGQLVSKPLLEAAPVFSQYLLELKSARWSSVQLAWNELSLELEQLKGTLSLYKRSFPRICAFIGIVIAVLDWIFSGNVILASLSVLIGLGAMSSCLLILSSAKRRLQSIFSLLEPMERQLLKREQEKSFNMRNK